MKIFIKFTLLLVFLVTIQSAFSESNAGWDKKQTDCKDDNECISLADLKQDCAYQEKSAKDVCPAVNKKYSAEIEEFECYWTQPCHKPIKISCVNGYCRSE